MRIAVDFSKVPEVAIPQRAYADDVGAVLSDICRSLDSLGAKFEIQCLGDIWPTRMAPDLVILLEQISATISSLNAFEGRFSLDFYEQSLQRRLDFERKADGYLVRCQSFSDWRPTMPFEELSRQELLEMFRAVRSDFVQFLSVRVPWVGQIEWFVPWMSTKE